MDIALAYLAHMVCMRTEDRALWYFAYEQLAPVFAGTDWLPSDEIAVRHWGVI